MADKLEPAKLVQIPTYVIIKNMPNPIFLEPGTENTYVIQWDTWSKETQKMIKEYQVNWNYYTSDGKSYDMPGEYNTVIPSNGYDKYEPPENAVKIEAQIKVVSKTHKVNKKDKKYFSDIKSEWVRKDIVRVIENTPAQPPVPTVEIIGNRLTASVLDQDPNTKAVEFNFVTNKGLYDLGTFMSGGLWTEMRIPSGGIPSSPPPTNIDNLINVTGYYTYSIDIIPGKTYNVRCRGVTTKQYTGTVPRPLNSLFAEIVEGPWSDWSDNSEGTMPPQWSTPLGSVMVGGSNITAQALNETSVKISWPSVPAGATQITIEYTTNKDYFDTTTSVQSMSVAATAPYAIVTGLTTGTEWFFRAKASNDAGDSGWSEIVSTIIGTLPAAPTTWSSRSVVKVGESNILYWTHNSQDGSDEKSAEIYIEENGVPRSQPIYVPPPTDASGINQYVFSSNDYTNDTKVLWSVRTRGILSDYGELSAKRSFDVLTPSIAYLKIFKNSKWLWDSFNFPKDTIYTAKGDLSDPLQVGEEVTKYPIYICGFTEPKGHVPVDAHFSITAMENYQSLDPTGEDYWVNEGEEVYSLISDLTKMESTDAGYILKMVLTPSVVYLMSEVSYKITFTVAMNNGLVTEAELVFVPRFASSVYMLNAEISYDEETASAYIQPYCLDENGDIIDDIRLAVYRKTFDGRFVELARELRNYMSQTVTDPHPALDYARYRLVGTSSDTGTIFFYDPPGYPIPETAIVIQWNEKWKVFNEGDDADSLVDKPWTGSFLKLPYNIDVSDTTDTDTELVNYIGREHPVSYYGTHISQQSTWNTRIPLDDKETLYALRRLSRYMGDCYVREPNGSGYWAHVTVNWNITHREVTIPVTINVTRVEGGV